MYKIYTVDILDAGGDVFVLYEQIVPSWYVFHYVPFDFFILKHGETIVDQNGRGSGFKIGAEIGRRFQHVNSCHLQANCLELS